eukprot:TRINITY_DN2186_c0_g1_i1.p1 TRINITY_DN2186_c0_g1~~TRINITY_DN2186_c0_g1_i1.p1  ORF type:complete len:238 (+),score=73.79 TRINITY_DN2186_c0_g1_i1:498-1211(+)
MTDTLVSSGHMDVVVIDSVAALVPRSELEGEMGDAQVGVQARLMSQAMRKLTASISKSNTLVIFINQIRMKIGVMFGNPETTTGGNALKYYSSVRLDVRKSGNIKVGEDVIGAQLRVKVVKNKLAAPFRQAEFDILFGEGISKNSEILDLGVKEGLITKSGAWYQLPTTHPTKPGEKLGQGRDKARAFLNSNPDITDPIEAELRKRLLSRQNTPQTTTQDDEEEEEEEIERETTEEQ